MRWRWPDWTGVGEKHWPVEPGQEIRRPKTLWDWLQLLIVPAILLVVVALWNASQASRDKSREDQSRQDATLTAYLNHMSELMLSGKLLEAEVGSPVRAVARSVTLAMLRRLDGDRKAAVIRFLYEGHLLQIPHEHDVYLNGADLQGAKLEGAQLRRAFLGDAIFMGPDIGLVNLGGANLSGANLGGANLTDAILGGAQLRRAFLGDAILSGANLGVADLSGAKLEGAKLQRAFLGGANLSGANLRDANLTDAYLAKANLRGATLTGANLNGANLVDASGLDLSRYISALAPADRKVFLDSQKAFLDAMSLDDALSREKLAKFNLSPEKLAKLRKEASAA
jgi:uncharacterized protein YjbI with pentapeptide repeats